MEYALVYVSTYTGSEVWEHVERAGGIYALVYSLEDAERAIEQARYHSFILPQNEDVLPV